MRLLFTMFIAASLAASAAADAPLAVLAEGESFPAELASVSDDWKLTFSTDGHERVVPAAELVRWGHCREAPGQPAVVLADGGLLIASVASADARELQADSYTFGKVAIPRQEVAGIVLQPPAELLARDLLLDRIVRRAGNTDLLVLVNRDEVAGTMQSLSADAIEWTTDIGPIRVEPQRVAAILFRSPAVRAAPAEPLRVWTGFSDGSRLVARRLVRSASRVEVTAAADAPWTALPEDLVFLQAVGGRAVYLSDLPALYRHVPYLDLDWPYHTDRNVLGGQLRAGGDLYLKGLGVHAASRLSYALEGKFRRLEASLAVDDISEGGGSVRFRVFVDGKEQFTSPTVRGGEPPAAMSVPVEGASRVDLIVDFADRGAVLDRADWLDARLVP